MRFSQAHDVRPLFHAVFLLNISAIPFRCFSLNAASPTARLSQISPYKLWAIALRLIGVSDESCLPGPRSFAGCGQRQTTEGHREGCHCVQQEATRRCDGGALGAGPTWVLCWFILVLALNENSPNISRSFNGLFPRWYEKWRINFGVFSSFRVMPHINLSFCPLWNLCNTEIIPEFLLLKLECLSFTK